MKRIVALLITFLISSQLVLADTFLKAKPAFTFNFNLCGIKSGVSYNNNRPFFPMVTTYIGNFEFLPKYPIPGIGFHGLSGYYFNHAATISFNMFPYLVFPMINVTKLKGKYDRYHVTDNQQVNILAGFSAWASASQILIDDNEMNINMRTLWLALRYVRGINQLFSYTLQFGYFHLWDPVIKSNNQGVFELQFGIDLRSTIQKFNHENQAGVKSFNRDYNFEWQGLFIYVNAKPKELNKYLKSYNAKPVRAGATGGGTLLFEIYKDLYLGLLMRGPAGKLKEYNNGIYRHYGELDFSFALMKSFVFNRSFEYKIGGALGYYIFDEIGVIDTDKNQRLVKLASLPGPTCKLLTGFNVYLFNLGKVRIGITLYGGLNFAYIPKGWVADENNDIIKDFPEINMSGFVSYNGLTIRF